MSNENSKSLFTEKARKKLRSPDDLDEYLRLTSPSMWLVLAACAALVIGLFVWGFFGTADTSVSVEGMASEDGAVCFLPSGKASNVHVGDPANVGDVQMEVTSVSSEPVSRDEARKIAGDDYLASRLVTDDWAYIVRMGGNGGHDLQKGTPLSVVITTERAKPINLISKDAA